MTIQGHSKIKVIASLATLLVSTVILTNCTVKGNGTQRHSLSPSDGATSNTDNAEPAAEKGDATSDTCLKLYAKRAAAMKLADETGTDTTAMDTAAETPEETACPADPAVDDGTADPAAGSSLKAK